MNTVCEEYSKAEHMDIGFLLDQAEQADTQGLLKVTVESATNLQSAGGNVLPNPFVQIQVEGKIYTTNVKTKSARPIWNQTFTQRVSQPPATIFIEVRTLG